MGYETERTECDGCGRKTHCAKLGPDGHYTLALCATCFPDLQGPVPTPWGGAVVLVQAKGGSGEVEWENPGKDEEPRFVVLIDDPNCEGHKLLASFYGWEEAPAALEAAVTGKDVLDQFRPPTPEEQAELDRLQAEEDDYWFQRGWDEAKERDCY